MSEEWTQEKFDQAMATGESVELNTENLKMVDTDPFSEHNYNEIQFTQLSRIYDVLLTLVQLQSPTAASHLIEAHSQGRLVAPAPLFSGEFLFNTANPDDNS